MTCQDKSLLAPGLASTSVISRYRQIIRKRAVLMFAVYACWHCCVSVCYQRWRWLSSGRLQVVLDGVIAV
ncbi:hypothetical protein CDR68_12850 [Salmonella enterica]|nr:hypothetical protein [Salmonella enterica]